jgi:phosphate-selective porin
MKYDFYDPNIRAKGTEIGSLATNFNATDIRYDTFGVGYLWYMNENFRLMLWYDRVKNEKTQLNNYTSDIKDDVLTCRVQYRF